MKELLHHLLKNMELSIGHGENYFTMSRGSFRYRPGENLYSERRMRLRILRLLPAIWRSGGFDILLTHAPARGLGDLDTRAHRGFACFVWLLDKYKPKYFIHGHVHRSYGFRVPQKTQRNETVIINACEYCAFDY